MAIRRRRFQISFTLIEAVHNFFFCSKRLDFYQLLFLTNPMGIHGAEKTQAEPSRNQEFFQHHIGDFRQV